MHERMVLGGLAKGCGGHPQSVLGAGQVAVTQHSQGTKRNSNSTLAFLPTALGSALLFLSAHTPANQESPERQRGVLWNGL